MAPLAQLGVDIVVRFLVEAVVKGPIGAGCHSDRLKDGGQKS